VTLVDEAPALVELTPTNTFVQPGTNPSGSDTAMTDGVPHAMLKAQRAVNSKLKDPNAVRRHLKRHHGVANPGGSPAIVHAQLHLTQLMNQGHSVDSGGNLGPSTDIGAGTSNFANEAPPQVYELAGYGPHHVRTPRGVDFFRKGIGTPITEAEYLGIKGQKASAKTARDANEAAAERMKATEKTASELTHQDLLTNRRNARSQYPAGHPERLKAERAVRSSRQTTGYRDAKGSQAHVSDAKKLAEAKKDPGFYSPAGPKKDAIPTVTAAQLRARGIRTAGPAPGPPLQSTQSREQELGSLTAAERGRYYAMRNAGVMHGKAIQSIRQAQSRPKAPQKVVTAVRRRRKG
jgi:hypothetical protein